MLSKCANPGCSASFHSLSEGKVFQLSFDDPRLPRYATSGNGKKPPRKVEFFWLCSGCSRTLTIQVDENRQVCTTALHTDSEEPAFRASAG